MDASLSEIFQRNRLRSADHVFTAQVRKFVETKKPVPLRICDMVERGITRAVIRYTLLAHIEGIQEV